jgi:hypothetical protein
MLARRDRCAFAHNRVSSVPCCLNLSCASAIALDSVSLTIEMFAASSVSMSCTRLTSRFSSALNACSGCDDGRQCACVCGDREGVGVQVGYTCVSKCVRMCDPPASAARAEVLVVLSCFD